MQKNHITASHLLQYLPANPGSIMGRPIPGVYRPAQHSQIRLLRGIQHLLGVFSSGRTEKRRAASLRQEGKGIRDLPFQFLLTHFRHAAVAVAVKSDFVPLSADPFRLPGIVLQTVTAQQEGSFCPTVFQTVQKRPGKPPRRAIVKGQRHIFGLLRGTNRTDKKYAKQQT